MLQLMIAELQAPRAPRASDIPLNGMETMGHKQWTRLKK